MIRRNWKEKRNIATEYYQAHKKAIILYLVLRAIVVAILVLSLLDRRYETAGICVLTLVLFLLPSFLERKLRIDLPDTLEIILLLFIFAAEILGEIGAWYVKVDGWDTMLHTINGFIFAAIGFSLADILNQHKSLNFELSPFFLAIVAFCFSMTIGVLWEFFEFGMDQIFLTDMQKDTVIHQFSTVLLDPSNSNRAIPVTGITDAAINGESLGMGGYLDIGLIDTMKDLVVNFIGAVVFSVIGYFYVKSRGKNRFATHFIPVVKKKEESGQNMGEKVPENN